MSFENAHRKISHEFSSPVDSLSCNGIGVPGIEYAMRYGNEELGYWNVLKYYASGMINCVYMNCA